MLCFKMACRGATSCYSLGKLNFPSSHPTLLSRRRHSPSKLDSATLLLARPKIKLFYSVKWCEFSKSAPLIVRIMHATNKIVHFITYVSFAGWQLLPFVSLLYLLIRRPHLHIAHGFGGWEGDVKLIGIF